MVRAVDAGAFGPAGDYLLATASGRQPERPRTVPARRAVRPTGILVSVCGPFRGRLRSGFRRDAPGMELPPDSGVPEVISSPNVRLTQVNASTTLARSV